MHLTSDSSSSIVCWGFSSTKARNLETIIFEGVWEHGVYLIHAPLIVRVRHRTLARCSWHAVDGHSTTVQDCLLVAAVEAMQAYRDFPGF